MKAPFEYNVRVFSNSSQGGRKYQEDAFCVAYQRKAARAVDKSDLDSNSRVVGEKEGKTPSVDENNGSKQKDLDFVYLGIFDGHGGKEAALFTRENLLENIISQREFWSDDDQLILKAIKQGFISTHYKMLKEVAKWPRTASGLLSTAGTTASVCFIMNNKYYTGHVGDSKIVLGKKNKETGMWIPYSLTTDHKPESDLERKRIYEAGGEVMNKAGVDRVVWFRPKFGHQGPVRRSTSFDRIPFLAVARSLGDLWSYNPENQVYVVSPEPDVDVVPIDPDEDKCLILASDGLWNVLLEHECIRLIQEMEEPDEVDRDLLNLLHHPGSGPMGFCYPDPTNPSQALVNFAVQRWLSSRLRADNTSVVTCLLDHRGPAKKECLQDCINNEAKSGDTVSIEKAKNACDLITDDQLLELIDPVVLPFRSDSTEYLISPDHHPDPKLINSLVASSSSQYDDVNLENIPLFPPSFTFSSNSVANIRSKRPVVNSFPDSDNYSLLSPSIQSLLSLAKSELTKPNIFNEPTQRRVNSVVNAAEVMPAASSNGGRQHHQSEQLPSSDVSKLKLYVNELPEESFQALSDALKLRNGNRYYKIINGVKVFRDYDESCRHRLEVEDDSSCEANAYAKKYRDECISVAEELVDGHCSGLSANNVFQEVAEIAKVWSLRKESENAAAAAAVAVAATAAEALHNPVVSTSPFRRPSSAQPFETKSKARSSFFKRFGSVRPSSQQLSRKRKMSGPPTYSPPAKHLRSSRWSRGKLIPSKTVNRWRQLAASFMTTTRLRAKKELQ